MVIVLLQIFLATLACAGLWWFWSRTSGQGKASLIIAAGFLLRAMAGQILFWISWLHLPIARSLQLGNGFWFFATDGPGYLAYADELIGRGVTATVFATAIYPSHVFVQLFTTFAALFGTVASIAILLNCAAFLGTCAIITRIGPRDAELPRLVALAAVAFGPGTILWSLQPLKDTFFLFLITALVGVCYRWQQLWREGERRSARRLLTCAALMLIVVYSIAGMRWYFAAMTCAVCIVFFILIAIRIRPKWQALASSVVLLLLLSQAFRIGGDDDIPRWARRLVDPRPVPTTRWYPITVGRYVKSTRRGFDNTPGATMIAPGPALAAPRVAHKSAAATNRVRAGEVLSASQVVTADESVTSAKPVVANKTAAVPKDEPVTSAKPVVAKKTPAVPKDEPVTSAEPVIAKKTAAVPKDEPVTSAKPVVAKKTAAVPKSAVAEKPVIAASPVPVTHRVMPANKRIVEQKGADGAPLPTPPLATTLVAGSSAMFLPRVLGQALGLIRIGGGRGFWFFVEADTLVFDAVLIFAAIYCARALRSGARITPLSVFIVLLVAITAAPMIYAVSNFGTLFRLRQMVYLLTALLPLTLSPPQSRSAEVDEDFSVSGTS